MRVDPLLLEVVRFAVEEVRDQLGPLQRSLVGRENEIDVEVFQMTRQGRCGGQLVPPDVEVPGGALAVRVDRVHLARAHLDEVRQGAYAHRLPLEECLVLPRVAEIGDDDAQAVHAEIRKGVLPEEQLYDVLVGIRALNENDIVLGDVIDDADVGLVVREPLDLGRHEIRFKLPSQSPSKIR